MKTTLGMGETGLTADKILLMLARDVGHFERFWKKVFQKFGNGRRTEKNL